VGLSEWGLRDEPVSQDGRERAGVGVVERQMSPDGMATFGKVYIMVKTGAQWRVERIVFGYVRE
jgi:hypothetical protein